MVWNTPTFGTGSAKWTSTLSSKLLLENGFSFNRERYDNLYQPGILAERNTDAWYRNVRKNDTSTGLLWNASGAQLGNYPDRYNLQGAASYVTGTHNIKVGLPYQWGLYPRYNNANADLYQTYNNGTAVPGDGAQHAAARAGGSGREPRLLRAGLVDAQPADAQLRPALRLNKQTIVGQPAQIGRFANVAGLRRHRRSRPGRTGRRACRSSTTCPATARRRSASASTGS